MSAKIEKSEDLEGWQNAIELSIDVYSKFRESRDYALGIRFAGLVYLFLPILPKASKGKLIKSLCNSCKLQKDLWVKFGLSC